MSGLENNTTQENITQKSSIQWVDNKFFIQQQDINQKIDTRLVWWENLSPDTKNDYLTELENVWSQERSDIVYDTRDQLSGLQTDIVSMHTFPLEALGSNSFDYAQKDPNGIQARWNKEHELS